MNEDGYRQQPYLLKNGVLPTRGELNQLLLDGQSSTIDLPVPTRVFAKARIGVGVRFKDHDGNDDDAEDAGCVVVGCPVCRAIATCIRV